MSSEWSPSLGEVTSSFAEASGVPRLRRSSGEGAGPEPLQETEAIRALMWRGAGLFRTRGGLSEAVAELDRSYAETREAMNRGAAHAEAWKRFNLLTVARLIARAALRREESRGGHFREESQTPDGEARRDDEHFSYVAAWEFKGVGAQPELHKEPLNFEYVKPSQRSYK